MQGQAGETKRPEEDLSLTGLKPKPFWAKHFATFLFAAS